MAGVTLQVVGYERLLKKLDAKYLVDPERETLVRRAGEYTKAALGPKLPRGPKNSANSLALSVTGGGAETTSRVSIARYPFIFLERGSQYPVTAEAAGHGAVRSHRTRPNLGKGQLRIKPRRFLSKTKADAKRFLTSLVYAAKGRIEAKWRES